MRLAAGVDDGTALQHTIVDHMISDGRGMSDTPRKAQDVRHYPIRCTVAISPLFVRRQTSKQVRIVAAFAFRFEKKSVNRHRKMCPTFALAAVIVLAHSLGAAGASAQGAGAARESLRTAIANGTNLGTRRGDSPRYRAALLRLYPEGDSSLYWMSNGALTAQGATLLAELRTAQLRGLRAAQYDAESLASALRTIPSGPRNTARDTFDADIDAWLTLSAMRFVDHAHRGRVDPASVGFAFLERKAEVDPESVVPRLSVANDVRALIDSLEPPYRQFRSLEQVLRSYVALAASSTPVQLPPRSTALGPDDRWLGAPMLRRLLIVLGDISPLDSMVARADSELYDAPLADGVKAFQRRHSLVDDGVVGKATATQLRAPIASRISQIELTLERWRWLPDVSDSRLVVINIPEFRLHAITRDAAGRIADEQIDVIVGSAYNGKRTPVLESMLRYVVFHPFWDVPPSIARREEVPRMRRDPGYSERMGMEIVRGGDVGATLYPINDANMQRVIAGTLRLRQRPGPLNALGPVKFVFPNRHNVYLHGTPEQYLFAQERRDFSHGCIRASDPEKLAEFVLGRESGWDHTRIEASMTGRSAMQTVTLEHPLRVFILYATVVIDGDGRPSFLPDVYGHDAALARALGVSTADNLLTLTTPGPVSRELMACKAEPDGVGEVVPR